ncbi:hypothetical protein RvY_02787 [Ramazzottius varieornatus]|uniref:Dynein attachment factor N-terminal domain-containing protein n=1 Tax=Ramazzottius varieornatus TaxID=947166 RepID=A0A1D1UVG8_RAMVA|nr:hypothetical protein RvY_02787 [Ramazzottius varieornatus]
MAAAARGNYWLDVSKLRQNMEDAIQRETDYKIRNEAKFRASAQNPATYEEFKYVQLKLPYRI